MWLCMQESTECMLSYMLTSKKHWRGLLRNSGAESGTAIPVSALRSTIRVQIIPNQIQAIHHTERERDRVRETEWEREILQVMFVRDKTARIWGEEASSYVLVHSIREVETEKQTFHLNLTTDLRTETYIHATSQPHPYTTHTLSSHTDKNQTHWRRNGNKVAAVHLHHHERQ